MLEQVIATDPNNQKGLWLLGIAETQAGNDARAIELWEQLLAQLEPGSGISTSLEEQLAMARSRLAEPGGDSEAVAETASDQAAEEEPAPEVAAEGPPEIPVVVSLGGDASGINTEQSALFIFAHPAGAVGMPLAVQRIISPRFPISITLSDANVLQPGTSLASHEEVVISARLSMSGSAISARLSMSGSANAGSGDVNAPAMTISPAGGESVKLVLDQVIP
jgi:cytochrome c-type biogenesis protein CcmH